MNTKKLTRVINYLIGISTILVIVLNVWFVWIKGTLESGATNDIRMLSYFMYLILFLIIAKFILKNKN